MKKKQVTLHTFQKMPLSEVKEIEGKCVVLVNGKVTPEIALKLIDTIGDVTVGAFVRDLITRFLNGGFKRQVPAKPEIPEYFKVLHQLFGVIMNTDKNVLLTAIKSLKMSPADIQDLQKDAKGAL